MIKIALVLIESLIPTALVLIPTEIRSGKEGKPLLKSAKNFSFVSERFVRTELFFTLMYICTCCVCI